MHHNIGVPMLVNCLQKLRKTRLKVQFHGVDNPLFPPIINQNIISTAHVDFSVEIRANHNI